MTPPSLQRSRQAPENSGSIGRGFTVLLDWSRAWLARPLLVVGN